MNERYRYGYGDEPGERDSTFSRSGSMTDRRADVDQNDRDDEEDEERRADRIREAESEPRTVATEPGPGSEPIDRTDVPESTSSSSVFDVEDEGAGSAPAPTGERERADERERAAQERERAVGEARTAGPASDAEERPPIPLGPPSRTTDEAPAPAAPAEAPAGDRASNDGATASTPAPGAATSTPSERTSIFETAGTAKPEAASPGNGTPTDETPAAVSTGVESPEPVPARDSAPGTETEMLVPGSGPAPVAAPLDNRSALLGSIEPSTTRARFLDIQAGFVDEPRQAVQEAERFVDELVRSLVRALETERAKLKATIEDGSTEDLRIALRGYRAFVDRLLNLTM